MCYVFVALCVSQKQRTFVGVYLCIFGVGGGVMLPSLAMLASHILRGAIAVLAIAIMCISGRGTTSREEQLLIWILDYFIALESLLSACPRGYEHSSLMMNGLCQIAGDAPSWSALWHEI